ncbi:hypothetical protein [Gallibacterium anatis]|nr:hypothetical protein [Gallibacterium anatis]WKS97694.1 hypothetical protein NYR19_02430 [Gallibacterium anatis]
MATEALPFFYELKCLRWQKIGIKTDFSRFGSIKNAIYQDRIWEKLKKLN